MWRCFDRCDFDEIVGIGTVLIVSHDSVWENIQGLMVFCHKSRQVSILWRSGLGILGCRVDGVLQPSGQRCPHPFLASFRRYIYIKQGICNS